MSLSDIAKMVTKRIWLVILLAVIAGVAAIKVPTKSTVSYEVSTQILAVPAKDTELTGSTFQDLANSDLVIGQAVKTLHKQGKLKTVTKDNMRDVAVTNSNGNSQILQLTVKGDSVADAKLLAKTWSKRLLKEVKSTFDVKTVKVVSQPTTLEKRGATLGKKKLLVIGAVVGAFIGVALSLVLELISVQHKKSRH